jgi:geranylgeranylglycerol-phosphate geranylgeranyltransferase
MLSMIRPLNVVLAGATVLLGAWLTDVPLFSLRGELAVLIVMLFTAAGNIMNDLCDLQSDRVNRPRRALPAGRISLKTASLFYRTGFIAGLVLSLYQSLYWIAIPALLLIVWYNLQLQKTVLAGNLSVAVLTVLPLWYAADIRCWSELLLPSLLILFVQLAREIIKDIEDMKGDSLQAAHTLPLVAGTLSAFLLALILNLVLWIVALLSWWMGYYNLILPLVVLLLIMPLTLWGFIRAWRQARWRSLQQILKLDMIIGFIVIIIGVT